jgi:outer membrane cobalamin receptor
MKYVLSGIVCCLFVAQAVAQDTSPAIKKTTDSIHIAVLDEVVVTASRVAEKILQSPVSIEKVNTAYFKSSPAPSFFDALENVKGVHMITPSLGFMEWIYRHLTWELPLPMLLAPMTWT